MTNSFDNAKEKALAAFRAAVERKHVVEEYMQQGKPLFELESQGISFWHAPTVS